MSSARHPKLIFASLIKILAAGLQGHFSLKQGYLRRARIDTAKVA